MFEFAGELNREIWLTTGLTLLDYNRLRYVQESFMIMHHTNGGISQDRIDIMPFDIMRMYLKEAERINPEEI